MIVGTGVLTCNTRKRRKQAHVLQSAQHHSKLKWNGTKGELAELFGILHREWMVSRPRIEKPSFVRLQSLFSIVNAEDKEEPVNTKSLRDMSDRTDTRKSKEVSVQVPQGRQESTQAQVRPKNC